MRLRDLRPGDRHALERFDVGAGADVWLAEVREIVAGLWGWVNDPDSTELDRRVLVLDDDGAVAGVAAHEAIRTASGVVYRHDRYLMVVAIEAWRQRSGLATRMVTSVIEEIRRDGGRSVTWLVHPANTASVWFSRNIFPEADETSPPEDRPYLAYTLTLDS